MPISPPLSAQSMREKKGCDPGCPACVVYGIGRNSERDTGVSEKIIEYQKVNFSNSNKKVKNSYYIDSLHKDTLHITKNSVFLEN